jgi:PHP-associated
MIRSIAYGLIAAALIAGTLADKPIARERIEIGGYRVLASDFHVHSFPFSWATLDPISAAFEARHRGLDVIALTPHNHASPRWPVPRDLIVLPSQEIVSAHYHLLAIGIQETIAWNQPAALAIAEVHRQGGIAIAAHPVMQYWSAYDAPALKILDGAEVAHPTIYSNETDAGQLRQFYWRLGRTAIGDSDFHGAGPIGLCRTYVFVNEASERGVLDALRAGRTVVYDGLGAVYGNAELIQLAKQDGRLGNPVPPQGISWLGLLGVLGLLGLVTK